MPLQMVMEQLLDSCCTGDPKRSMGLGADNMTLIVVVLLGREWLSVFLFAICFNLCSIPKQNLFF